MILTSKIASFFPDRPTKEHRIKVSLYFFSLTFTASSGSIDLDIFTAQIPGAQFYRNIENHFEILFRILVLENIFQ